MSRRLAVLAGMCVLGVFAGVAGAAGPTGGGNPPPGGTPPFDPPPPPAGSTAAAGCPTHETHPIPCRLWTVSCSPNSSATACTTASVSGSPSASVRKLALHLPRRFVAITLACTQNTERITCRVVSKTTGAAAGSRTVVLRLPNHFAVLHITCGTSPRAGFACHLRT